MPSTMMHIKTALKVKPNASTLFLIGNIAPDTIKERKEKDRSHYRGVTNRYERIMRFAHSIQKDDEFGEGMLLHLFLDWKWDEGPFTGYKKEYENRYEDWFYRYRREIDLSGSFLFHHSDIHTIWNDMIVYNINHISGFDGVTPHDIKRYIEFLYQWFQDNDIGPSQVFTPEFIENFMVKVAGEYSCFKKQWLS